MKGWMPVAVALLGLNAACQSSPSKGPPPCQAIAAPPGSDAPDGVVWGFVDLHAHPAVELAFGGRLIWGSALDDAPVNASELPVIESCPVETHDPNAATPIDHLVGSIAFPAVSKIAGFAHAPVGDLSFRPTDAWPNARDVIHQQMNVSSIRRAYEGGLRLMFASTTDNQAVAALLQGPDFVNAFVPDPNADYVSAQKQLELIDTIVERNENWMGIARTPQEARSIIAGGRLAVVLSLEMDGVTQSQLDTLVDHYGVRHVIPVHLVDNDVGGTAANSDLFNTASAAVSEIYRSDSQPLGFMDVAPATGFAHKLGWAQTVGPSSPPVYAGFQNIAFPAYKDLCYEPLDFCAGKDPIAPPVPFVELGQINFRGLCNTREQCMSGARPGAARIAHMMAETSGSAPAPLFVDVSHMGNRAVGDALTVTPTSTGAPCSHSGAAATYPLIASHGDIAHLCDSPTAPGDCQDYTVPKDPISPSVGSERSLHADQARAIVARHGVLGLGTGLTTYMTRTVLDARGGPLLAFDPSNGGTSGCVTLLDAGGLPAAGCQPVPSIAAVEADPTQRVTTLEVQTLGGVSLDPRAGSSSPNAQPYVRVDLLGPDGRQSQHRVIVQPLDCSTGACSASVDLGTQDGAVVLAENCDGTVSPGATPASGTACTTTCPTTGAGESSASVDSCAALCTVPGSCGSGPAYTLDHIENVSVEWLYLGCDLSCQEQSDTVGRDLQCQSTGAGPNQPQWTIDQATVIADTPTGAVSLIQVGPHGATPVTVLDSSRGSFGLYQREDRPSVFADTPATGHLLRISLTSGPEEALEGASTTRTGANVCAAVRAQVDGVCVPAPPPPPGATECPSGWTPMNQRGSWGKGTSLFAFARFAGSESSVCGADVTVLDWDGSDPPFTLDEVKVEVIEDPVAHFVRRYAAISKNVAEGQMGTVGFGTDFNGLNGMMDISEDPMPEGALAASACTVTDDGGMYPGAGEGTDGGAEGGTNGGPPPQPLAPLRFRHADGTLGGPVLIDERGLATYGLLADLMAIIRTYPGCGNDVHDSLMLSAEATLRAWETMLQPGIWDGHSLPTRPFVCPDPPGVPQAPP